MLFNWEDSKSNQIKSHEIKVDKIESSFLMAGEDWSTVQVGDNNYCCSMRQVCLTKTDSKPMQNSVSNTQATLMH